MKQLASAFCLMLPLVAQAQTQMEGSVDVYYIPAAKVTVTVPNAGHANEDGSGGGLRARLAAGPLWAAAEYQRTSYDFTDSELKQSRFGVGAAADGVGGLLEYVAFNSKGDDIDGFAAHLRYDGGFTNWSGFFGQVGYLLLTDRDEDEKGPEFSFGLHADFTPNLAGTVSYRHTSLEGKRSRVEVEFNDVRAGLRFSF